MFLNWFLARAEDTRLGKRLLSPPEASCWGGEGPRAGDALRAAGVNDQAKVIGSVTQQLLIGFALVQHLPLGFPLAAAGVGLGLWRQVPRGKRLL